MKRLKMIRFSEAKELTKGEQKNLRGGTNGLTLACRCRCDQTPDEWLVYTATGECNVLGTRPMDRCSGTATCWPL
jgi:hypothetical protein